MNDYGIRPGTLFGLDPEKGYYPNAEDVYNPNLPGNGNSNYKVESKYHAIEWLKTTSGAIDLRLFYTDRDANSWSKCRWNEGDGSPHFYRVSSFTGR